jgi:hypothetical protein
MKINGAGVIPLEYYTNKQSRRDIAIILFYDVYKHMFIDAGGSLSLNENIKMAALRELREESCNLFNLKEEDLQTKVQTKSYVGYFVALNKNVRFKYYYNNLKILKERKNKNWYETSRITRVYLSDLVNKIKENNLVNNNFNNNNYNYVELLDAYNNKIKVHNRVVNLISNSYKLNLLKDLKLINLLTKKEVTNKFLKDTVSYVSLK